MYLAIVRSYTNERLAAWLMHGGSDKPEMKHKIGILIDYCAFCKAMTIDPGLEFIVVES